MGLPNGKDILQARDSQELLLFLKDNNLNLGIQLKRSVRQRLLIPSVGTDVLRIKNYK